MFLALACVDWFQSRGGDKTPSYVHARYMLWFKKKVTLNFKQV